MMKRSFTSMWHAATVMSKQAIWKYVCPLASKKEDGTKIPRLKGQVTDEQMVQCCWLAEWHAAGRA